MMRDRVFLIALGASGLLHLSMVTLFSIGIYFPREEHEYYDFQIVDVNARNQAASFSDSADSLDLPTQGELAPGIADSPSFGSENDERFAAPSLPSIELPRLEFADLDRLRLREMGADAESRYRRHSSSHPGDSWARFGQELERFGHTLTRLPFLSERSNVSKAPPEVLTHPAPDFKARIEWLSDPKDRQLIFAPPIDALWGLQPAALQPMTFIIRVNAEGRVVEVISPAEGDSELVSQVGRQLLRYRFAPHNANQPDTQLASYTLSGDPPRP
ncbi:MAG: hypothetical protein R6W89_04300 [Candidatus Hydrogenedentota bacterium]